MSITAGNVQPASVTFGNNTASYVLSGSNGIAGVGPLVMNGSGAVTIYTANSYNGGTSLNAGLLNIGNVAAARERVAHSR